MLARLSANAVWHAEDEKKYLMYWMYPCLASSSRNPAGFLISMFSKTIGVSSQDTTWRTRLLTRTSTVNRSPPSIFRRGTRRTTLNRDRSSSWRRFRVSRIPVTSPPSDGPARVATKVTPGGALALFHFTPGHASARAKARGVPRRGDARSTFMDAESRDNWGRRPRSRRKQGSLFPSPLAQPPHQPTPHHPTSRTPIAASRSVDREKTTTRRGVSLYQTGII